MKRIITAREQHEMLLPWREAAFNQDLVDRLHGEFHDWWKTAPEDPDDDREWEYYGDGSPMNSWAHIERFMSDRYPAAHKNQFGGNDEARPNLLSETRRNRTWGGPEEIGQHGYDPAEIAAGMLVLHNRAHANPPYNDEGDSFGDFDMGYLTRAFDKRQQMQRDYEQRQTTAASQYLLPGMPSRKPGTKPTPEPEDEGDWWRDSWRMTTPEPEPNDDYQPSDDDDDDWQHESWMHVSPHKLEPGTELHPGGGASPYNGKTLAPGHRHNVWIDRPHAMKGWTDEMKQHSPDAKFYYYDVEPLDKPEPNAWGPELGYAVPGARIVQRRDDFDPEIPEGY